MNVKREVYGAIVVLILVILISAFVSAGMFDWFKRITGQATSQPTNVSITVSGVSPVVISVYNQSLSNIIVSNDGTGAQEFYVTVYDSDGAADINTTSVLVNFSMSGETLRQNLSCVQIGADVNAFTKNFSCTVDMWYFDAQGTWDIIVGAKDLGNMTYIYNTTATFSLPQLQGIEISPVTLNWPGVTPGTYNQTSTNDPTIINNTGNYISNISVIAKDLYGQQDSAKFIGVANMSASNDTSGDEVECTFDVSLASTLINGTEVQVINSNLTKGNHSLNDGSTGQEYLYYCLRTVPMGISSQTYSTSTAGSWTIKIN